MGNQKIKTASTALAVFISLAFLALTIPHSAEVWSQFEKPGSWLPWFSAVGLEVLVAYAMFVVCERGYEVWVKVVAGVLVTIAIAASFILNFAHYLSINNNGLYAAGLAALLPGLVALLGAMLPGLMAEKEVEVIHDESPTPAPQVVDPWPMMQAALEAMEKRIDAGMETARREITTAVSELPALVARTVENQLPPPARIESPEEDDSRTAEAIRLKGVGWSNVKIGQELGMSEGRVRQLLKKGGAS